MNVISDRIESFGTHPASVRYGPRELLIETTIYIADLWEKKNFPVSGEVSFM